MLSKICAVHTAYMLFLIKVICIGLEQFVLLDSLVKS